jgi:hypothetical protein
MIIDDKTGPYIPLPMTAPRLAPLALAIHVTLNRMVIASAQRKALELLASGGSTSTQPLSG